MCKLNSSRYLIVKLICHASVLKLIDSKTLGKKRFKMLENYSVFISWLLSLAQRLAFACPFGAERGGAQATPSLNYDNFVEDVINANNKVGLKRVITS